MPEIRTRSRLDWTRIVFIFPLTYWDSYLLISVSSLDLLEQSGSAARNSFSSRRSIFAVIRAGDSRLPFDHHKLWWRTQPLATAWSRGQRAFDQSSGLPISTFFQYTFSMSLCFGALRSSWPFCLGVRCLLLVSGTTRCLRSS